MTPERVIGLGFVGLLHVVAISAIVLGLKQHYMAPPAQGPLVIDATHIKTPPQTPPNMPVVDVKHTQTVQPPVIEIAHDRGGAITLPPAKPDKGVQVVSIPDTVVMGLTATHTSPPYPLLDRRLGHEGTVTLKLQISPQGVVTGAEIVKSSGYTGLDEAAMSWVVAHWHYRPATHDGSAVPSQAYTSVMFSLRNAG